MPEPVCDHCQGPSVAFLRYSNQRLCRRHFQESVDRRTRRELHDQGPYSRGTRFAVAVSGGKDSITALHVIREYAQDRRDAEVIAVTIDEGIEGYRPPAVHLVAEACKALDIEHHVKRVKDFAGLTMDAIHQLDAAEGQCSFCGVFRRRLMNDFAKEVGADRLVTGHNLDDAAQSILMNLASAQVDRLARLAPHEEAKDGLIPRIMPLRSIPESEVYLYAMLRGFEWHDAECPYSVGALRGAYRDALYRLEEARPGTRHALLRTHERLKPALAQLDGRTETRECLRCGEPTSGLVCKACQFRERFQATPAR